MDFKVKMVDYVRPIRERKFTIGKVYEVKNNYIIADNGEKFHSWSFPHNGKADFEALKKWFSSWYVFELVEDEKMFTKKDLKTGMFGYFDNETNDYFVIVGDRFIYQKGLGDEVSKLNDNLAMPSGRKITALYEASCFDQATTSKQLGRKLIWKRGEKKPIEEKPLYNGKVVCVDLRGANANNYTVGKIYEFKNGRMTSDSGYTFGKNGEFHTFKDWEDYSSSKFIEVKE